MKYCSNCGSKVEGSFCTNCGAKIQENLNSGTQLNGDVNAYLQQQMESKQNKNGYRLAVGVIMIILGAIIFVAGMVVDSALNGGNYLEALKYIEYAKMNLTLAFILPGLAILAGGILSIVSRKMNTLLLISGICYLSAAVFNICAISDISLLTILCLIFGPINIVFYTKTR